MLEDPPCYTVAFMWTRDARGAACLGGIRLSDLVAGTAGFPSFETPAYVYDLDAIAAEAKELTAGFGGAPHLIAYAVKANTAGPVVRALARAGCGADVVSGGELRVALGCGISPDAILFSGVAKSALEIDGAIAAGERGILAIQAESVEEIARIEARAAALGRTARVSVRVNPSVVADTHAHVATGHDEAKFGIGARDLEGAWRALEAATHVRLVGLSCHVGSQLTRTDDYLAAADALLPIAIERDATLVAGGRERLEFIDFGGGFGIDYGAGCPVRPADFARACVARLQSAGLGDRVLAIEPGRSLVAAHGVLCARVIMAKRSAAIENGDARAWLMIDAGMNDLLRPALYGALHRIESIDGPSGPSAKAFRVVGPVCESSDDFGAHRFDEPLPSHVVIRDAGAYGYVMASEYNGRALPQEVFVRGGEVVAVSAPRSVDAWVAERLALGKDAPLR